ncbi:hypothetical protein [Rothia dentocariosa]|nr:hypothetical protein [Rothia dentocariosa]EFJ78249.1 hypothetical protein HMPREF0734_01304 [Rothia dentocariosa M567]
MKGLICDYRNVIRLTATVGVSAIFAGADVAARSTAPNVMRKVLDIKNVSNTSYGTIGKTKSVVALRARVSALAGTITEYIKATGRSRKTKRLWNSVSDIENVIRQSILSMRLVNAPQILGKQYSPLRELLQTVFQRLSSQLYMASLVWGGLSMLRGGRTKERQYTPGHPEYVALTSALKGGYFSGFFEAVCVFLMILGARAVVPASKLSALSLPRLQIAGIVWISYLIFPLVLALAQRPLVVRAQHASPGGLLFAACDILVPPLVYLVVTLGMFQEVGKAATVGSCALVFYLIYAAWLKPWKPGLTRTQVRHKIQETKRMTRELVGDIAQEYAGMMQERAEIMQKYADVDDPAIKNLFLPTNRYRIPLDYEKRGALPRKR